MLQFIIKIIEYLNDSDKGIDVTSSEAYYDTFITSKINHKINIY